MKSLYQYSYLRRAILVALLGTSGATYAATLIDKDTLIDSNSPVNEDYQVENGATLTAKGAVAGQVTISDGHLVMDGGQINRYLMLDAGSTAAIDNANVNFAALMGDAQLRNTTIETQLIVNEARLVAQQIQAQQFVAFVGDVAVENSVIANDDEVYSGAVDFNGTNGTFIGSVIKGFKSGIYLNGTNSVGLDDTSIWAVKGAAFMVNTGTQHILLRNGSTAGSDTGELLTARKGSEVSLSLTASQAAGTIRAEEDAVVDVALSNGSHLSGAMVNVSSLSLDSTSLYEMTASSDIKALSMTGGTVKFSVPQDYGTLTLGTLSGSGHFMMNADVLTGKADLLDITDTATGKHTLHVAATGREATSNDALTLVRTGAGDAEFTLNGGRLDVGAWQHALVRNGNNWELVQATGSTSASTDAMLSMASAPQFIHESELNVLRSRLNDNRAQPQSGMWGTVLHSRSDVDGAWGSAYRLEQNGMMLGGDKVTSLNAGELTTGAWLSQSTGQVKHARGGQSRVTSYGGGLYATLNSPNGWYTSGSAQINHFANKLSARMSDGGTARADWNSWGYGLGVEAGRHIALSDATRLTPFAGLDGWMTPSESVSLNNEMTAETGDGRSLQAQAGLRVTTRLEAGEMQIMPYATAALSQGLVKNGSTRINETYDFTNDFTGTGGKFTGGISVMITPSTQVWLDASYAKSEHAESPVVGNVGLRVDF
ncbi:TPA: autotransporter outer membrane beta-barrel domain-containing protein [Enterobacter cloacae]|uniref:autotransporter outer membrane beta-barrel domain-containing protein n=2 Tax=Enterobacter cloacae TaxID=550 RepID=UPI002004C116|nr:autotransporter outer membrane beta-barrel domain-containing protein [Enterobacter cloacae]MCK6718127.1 autotransporter outer membrane beta-barrel domain-containing protein [Enterobacter cloacae]HBN5340411.1 autotransporter outer membrane beta-barrel domain-containing protein [Enterobacter cloacae]